MNDIRYKKVDEIEIKTSLLDSISFKPKKAPIICIVFGMAFFAIKSIWAILLGLFMIVMAIFVIKFVEDKKVIDIYQDGALIYKPDDNQYAYFLKYSDIVEWEVKDENGHDYISFKFADGYKMIVETFEITRVYNALDQVIHDKEARAIQHEKNKSIKWANPLDTIKNLPNILKNIKDKFLN